VSGPDIPVWVQAFVLGGIALVTLLVPAKILFELTKTSRDRTRRARDLTDRLRERFGGVRLERGFFGPHRIRFTIEGRAAVVSMPDDEELEVRLEPNIAPAFPFVARTRGAVAWPVAFEGFRMLPMLRTFDALALDGLPAGEKPKGLAESLFVLRKLPGVRTFELRMSPRGGFRLRFDLRTEDLIHRPDELESAVHHAFQLYDALVSF
jgi:hypothetical protein